jgi:hypothetical protein
MGCDVAKFTITKGVDNNFVFTIKADGSTLPMVIEEPADTFDATLILLSDGSTALSKSLTVTDAASGQVMLTLYEGEVAGLISEKGSQTDRYYVRPTYKLLLDCNTTNNGDFLAKVPEVYVD